MTARRCAAPRSLRCESEYFAHCPLDSHPVPPRRHRATVSARSPPSCRPPRDADREAVGSSREAVAQRTEGHDAIRVRAVQGRPGSARGDQGGGRSQELALGARRIRPVPAAARGTAAHMARVAAFEAAGSDPGCIDERRLVWASRKCRQGWLHGRATARTAGPPRSHEQRAPPCVHFAKGSCKYGERCRFRHDCTSSQPAAPPSSARRPPATQLKCTAEVVAIKQKRAEGGAEGCAPAPAA